MSVSSKKRTQPIVLVGFMASGKSTIGAILAQLLDIPFVDTDDHIEQASGMPIAEIFRKNGEASFREAERAAILGLLNNERRVIAIGGGAFVDPVTRAKLAAEAHTIWLDPPFETIGTRLAGTFDRPMATSRTEEQLRELWLGRRVFYALADLHIRISHGDATRTAREIIRRLESS